jgi:hypothetical protein
MTRPPSSRPKLDLSTLAFPSDQVTIKELRSVQPHLFAGDDPDAGAVNPAVIVFATIAVERVLARKAFAAATGLPDPHPDEDRRELVRMLDSDYRRYGLSRGRHHTNQLVKSFEMAAADQAKGRVR